MVMEIQTNHPVHSMVRSRYLASSIDYAGLLWHR